MIDAIKRLLTPEAQADPHYWAATFGGHFWIILGPWGIVAIALDMWTAAVIIPLAYLIGWEGLQLYRAKKRTFAIVMDCICDAVAATLACISAASLGNGMPVTAMCAWSASLAISAVGWWVRDD